MRIACRSLNGNWTLYADNANGVVLDKFICSYQYLQNEGPAHKHFKIMRYSKFRNYVIYHEISISQTQTFCKLNPAINQQTTEPKKDA